MTTLPTWLVLMPDFQIPIAGLPYMCNHICWHHIRTPGCWLDGWGEWSSTKMAVAIMKREPSYQYSKKEIRNCSSCTFLSTGFIFYIKALKYNKPKGVYLKSICTHLENEQIHSIGNTFSNVEVYFDTDTPQGSFWKMLNSHFIALHCVAMSWILHFALSVCQSAVYHSSQSKRVLQKLILNHGNTMQTKPCIKGRLNPYKVGTVRALLIPLTNFI